MSLASVVLHAGLHNQERRMQLNKTIKKTQITENGDAFYEVKHKHGYGVSSLTMHTFTNLLYMLQHC